MYSFLQKAKAYSVTLWIVFVYGLTHIPYLRSLPIFADEAIYIRWAQLIIAEPSRFLFFSMSDGKPPLFIWLLSVFLRPWTDPLLGARFFSLLVGLATVFVLRAVVRLVSRSTTALHLVTIFSIFAPFWWMYHRFALMDGLLTFCATACMYFSLRIVQKCVREKGIAFDTLPLVLFLGVSFGGALLTKTPAIFFIPSIAVFPLFVLTLEKTSQHRVRSFFESSFFLALGGGIGGVFFLLLSVSPFFGTLFARSSDFTFSLRELLSGEWKFVLFSSIPREFLWIGQYMTPALLIGLFFGLFTKKRVQILFYLLAALLFAVPLIVFGRVLYPRYFLPIAPFVTIASALGYASFFEKRKPLYLYLFLGAFLVQSVAFMIPSMLFVANTPYVQIDRVQYLEEWSAGFGIAQVRDYVRRLYVQEKTMQNQKPSIIVLTEGSFGTLPDGLLLYFSGKNQLDGVEVHGIGVGPSVIPRRYIEQKENGARVFYLVNEHRLKIADQNILREVFSVSRPNNAPKSIFFEIL